MRNSKAILLAVALLAVAFTARAGDDAVVKPKPDTDKTVVVPARSAKDAAKPSQTPEPKPNAAEAPQPQPKPVQAPTSPKPPESGVVAAPATGSEPGDKGGLDRPPRGGNGGRGNGGRGGGHNNGGYGWRGRHDQWRHRNYHGSWSFLWHFGPVIFPAPVYFPHVIRMPRHNVGVYVRHTGDDYVGAQFANSVREHLREQGLKTVYSADDAKIELYVVSMDEDPEETGYGSAVSVSYILYPGHKFITAQIIDVGVDEVDDLAQSVAGYADDLVDQYR
jgi:hypothetical protein